MTPLSSTLPESGRRPWPKAFLLAIGLLAALELGVARREWVWSFIPRSNTGVVDVLEREVIARVPEPSVVVFGSSRARDAIAPRQLASELHVAEGSVLNLALTGGTPFDALYLYRRHRDTFRRARLIVLAVEDWHFNGAIAPGARERRYATLGERIGVFDREGTLSLVAGWLWRTYDAQRPIREVALTLLHGEPDPVAIADDGRIVWRANELDEGPVETEVERWAHEFLKPFRWSEGREAQLRDLVRLAGADGVRVLLVQLPWRDAYVDVVERDYPAVFTDTRAAIQRVPDAETILFDRGSAIGLGPTLFSDYGHLTRVGARRFTALLAARIRETYANRFP